MNKPKLSISLVDYNLTDMVINLIKSAYGTAKNIELEILVVDNKSADEPEKITQNFPKVSVIRNKENVFFTKADNQNILRTTGDYIMTITPDAYFLPGALDTMVEFLEQHTDVGAIVPKISYPDGKLQVSYSPFPNFWFGVFSLLGIHHFFPNNFLKRKIMPSEINYDPDKIREAEVLYGACIVVRREVLNTVGGKDEKFVHGWDEYDWCYRIRQAGWKLCYVPEARIVHLRSVSFNKAMSVPASRKILRKHHWTGFLRLYKKYFSYPAYCFLKALWLIRYCFLRYK